jgi:hypothetical protein
MLCAAIWPGNSGSKQWEWRGSLFTMLCEQDSFVCLGLQQWESLTHLNNEQPTVYSPWLHSLKFPTEHGSLSDVGSSLFSQWSGKKRGNPGTKVLPWWSLRCFSFCMQFIHLLLYMPFSRCFYSKMLCQSCAYILSMGGPGNWTQYPTIASTLLYQLSHRGSHISVHVSLLAIGHTGTVG